MIRYIFCAFAVCELTLKYHRPLSEDSAITVYSMPLVGEMKGVLALFHGCKSVAEGWFTLPESVRIVEQAHKASLVTVAFQANNTELKCWADHAVVRKRRNLDVHAVNTSLQSFLAEHRLTALPLYGLGVSSGGRFLSLFCRLVAFASVTLMISQGVPLLTSERLNLLPLPRRVAFVYMPKDALKVTSRAINQTVRSITSLHRRTKTRVFEIAPHPLTADGLRERLQLSLADANALVQAAVAGGFVDDGGLIRSNPRKSQLLDALTSFTLRSSPAVAANGVPFNESLSQQVRVGVCWRRNARLYRNS
jgi:hypothetical protein